MIKMTTMRIWISVSIAWPLFWILVFDRWFLLSPIGLLIAFGLPLAGWLIWFKFYRATRRKCCTTRELWRTRMRKFCRN